VEDPNASNGKETRITLVTLHKQVHQIITLVINLLHTTNSAKSQITNLITKILVITRTTLAVKVPMVQIGNETARIANKRTAKMLLKEQIAKLEGQSKTDTKGKKKEKAVKSANLLARIDDDHILLESRMEDINSYNERVFIAPKSDKTDIVEQMDVDNEDAVSLGNESIYLNARDFYAKNALDGDDWDKYSDGLLNK
jgi:hypothetical protein